MATKRKSSSLRGLGLTPRQHLEEAHEFTKDLERKLKIAQSSPVGAGGGCPGPDYLMDIGDLVGFIRANLRYTIGAHELTAGEKEWRESIQKRYMGTVVPLKRRFSDACRAKMSGKLSGLRRRRVRRF